MSPLRVSALRPALLLALVAGAVALGVLVRSEEVASSPVIPAEDPYTHMALLRAHLMDGDLDPLYEGGTLYPPGMHAILAGVHAFTGIGLYTIFLHGPVIFGAISILGVAFLLWRSAGPVAAVVGSIAMALAPELVFRTTMMAPTAMDLAVLPFLLYALLETMRGRLGWSTVVGGLSLFMILAHPWLLAVMAPVTLGIVLLSMVLQGQTSASHRTTALGGALAVGTIGGALLLAVSVCWSQCGLGFQEISGGGMSSLDRMGTGIAVACLLAGGAFLLFRRPVMRMRARIRPMPWLAATGLAALAAGAVAAVTVPAVQAGMPRHVDLPRMFGWPILGLGLIGLVAVPFMRSRAAWAGAALVTVTYPFVVHNPLDSPFWPHRTAAYFGVGLVILAGIGAAALVALAHRVGARTSRRTTHARPMLAGTLLTMLVAVPAAAAVYTATPPDYETGWYRLYGECEFDALRQIAPQADADTIIIAGDWRPKLVTAAFSTDPTNVWYDESFFRDAHRRDEVVVGQARAGRDVIVLVDRHVIIENRDIDASFVHSEEWIPMGSYCSEGVAQPRLSAYRSEVEI